MTERAERLFRRLLRIYPRDFREPYEADLVAFFLQDRAHPRYGAGRLRPLRFWMFTMKDLLHTAWTTRRGRRHARDAGAPGFATRWRRDLRFAWRGLWSAPLVTLAALAVLTIGIGASTSIFSVVDAVVLRGLPFPDENELVLIREASGNVGDAARGNPVRPQTYLEWRRRQRTFVDIGAAAGALPLVPIDPPVQPLAVSAVSASLLDVLRVRPALGRPFGAADEQPGARPVALLSDALWRSRFLADPSVVGRLVAFRNHAAVEIIGVMPPEFRYPISISSDLWVPWVPAPAEMTRDKAHVYKMSVIARLPPGTAHSAATASMMRLHRALSTEDPRWFGDREFPIVLSWRDALVSGSVRSWMLMLLAAVAGVLLIACLNVANLLVARAIARAPDLGMRAALGASRWDLARALLLESLMLSLLGAAAGVLLAVWGVEILRSALPASVPRLASVALDLRVIAVALGSAVVTGLVFGTLPALQASRRDLVAVVGPGGRSSAGARGSRTMRAALVVAEVAVASVLLVGSGLFLSSFMRVASIPLGFDPRNVVSLTGGYVSTSAIRPPTPDRREAVASAQTKTRDALSRMQAVPGVVSVAAVGGGRPLGGSGMTIDLRRDEASADATPGPEPYVRGVTSGYLDVVGGTLLRGRWIAEGDVPGSDPVIVLSDEAADVYFGASDPIGRRVRLDGLPFTVIGTVQAMRVRGPESPIAPEAFVSFFQGSHTKAELIARTKTAPAAIVPALTNAVRAVFPDDTTPPRTLEQDYARLLAQRKFNMVVLSLFGVVAIVVAALGIYGLMAYVVEQRRREIGIRVALGAEPTGILRMVLTRAAWLLSIGLVTGIAMAGLLEQLVRAFLFEPRPFDPVVYGAAALSLLTAGLVAAFGPARRAARVDPLVALRAE